MSGAGATLLLLLLGGRATFMVGRSLNAPRDGWALAPDGLTDGTDDLNGAVTGKAYLPDVTQLIT